MNVELERMTILETILSKNNETLEKTQEKLEKINVKTEVQENKIISIHKKWIYITTKHTI